MSLLRSPRLMLILLAALLAAPAWVTPAVLGAGALALVASRLHLFLLRRTDRRDLRGEQIRLGTDRGGQTICVEDRELAAHGLLLGASGSGKTTALLAILDQQIRRGVPVVAIDLKGSPAFAAQLAEAAAAASRPFKLWTPDGPGCWNPLQHGNATEGKDKLVATERFSEPHYQRAAERYVQVLLHVLGHVHPGQAPTLAEVVRLMDPKRLAPLLREVPQALAHSVQDYCAGLTFDQVSAVRGLQTRLAVITESTAGAYLEPRPRGTIDLRAALDGPEVVLFSLNSSRYGKFAAQLGTLAVQDLICATGLRLEALPGDSPPRLAMVAIDEFSAIGGDHVAALFARGREAGAAVLVATQEMADLAHAGRGMRDQVIGSTAFKLILRQDVPESAQAVAEIAGTQRSWEETRQIGGGMLFPGPAGRGTRREVERFIIAPNDVKSLRTGEAVLISKLGSRPPQVIHVTPPQRVQPKAPDPTPAVKRQVSPDRGAGVRSGNARAKRIALPGRTPRSRKALPGSTPRSRTALSASAPRSRYPDPGVTR